MVEYFEWIPDGFYWSIGSHPEFKWQARIWRNLPGIKKGSIGPKVEIYIGIGNTLEEAIWECRRKYGISNL